MTLTAVTPLFQVDPDGGGPGAMAVRALTDGGFAFAWQDRDANVFERISVRKYDAAYQPVTEVFTVAGANRDDVGNGFGFPSMAAYGGGGFAVEYNDLGGGTSMIGGGAYRGFWSWVANFDADGALVGQAGPPGQPQAGVEFDTIWASVITENGVGGLHSAYVQSYFVNGVSGKRLVVNGQQIAYAPGAGLRNPVAATDFVDGVFVVATVAETGGAAGDTDLVGYIVRPGFSTTGFVINENRQGAQGNSLVGANQTITTLTNGSVVVAWTDAGVADDGIDPGAGVRARIFDVNGQAVGGEIVLSGTPAGDETAPVVTALSGGRWLAIWSEEGTRAQAFSATGARVGEQVDLGIGAEPDRLSADVLPDDLVVIAWGGTMAGVWRFTPPNTLPVTDDESFGDFYSGEAKTISAERGVLAGDADADGDPLAAVLETGPANGVLQLNADGSFTYTANAGFSGTDGFTYRASDGKGLSGIAEVVIGVQPVGVTIRGDNTANVISRTRTVEGQPLPTALRDYLYGQGGDDQLDGHLGPDRMDGGNGHDLYTVDHVDDEVIDSAGRDTVRASISYTLGDQIENLLLFGSATRGHGNAKVNQLTGNALANELHGLDGNDTLDGKGGADRLYGGAGNDTYRVDDIGDVASETDLKGLDSGGFDRVLATATHVLSEWVEQLTLQGSTAIDGAGNTVGNFIFGNSAANTLTGGGGNDVLDGGLGGDTILGGADADTITGGGGQDTLTGGASTDRFVYVSAHDSSFGFPDTITDFSRAERDRIDLRKVDADTRSDGNQAFRFIGTAAFTGAAGELRYEVHAGYALVTANLNGELEQGAPYEFAIRLNGVAQVFANDFHL